jgi:antitoxin (DNA-binding transcriptional repressor) of toxin-antitoxin stability system
MQAGHAHIGLVQARKTLEALIERAHGGETTIITRWRRPYAKLQPLVMDSSQTLAPQADRG